MTDAIVQWLLSAGEGKFLATVLISMLPVIELRGGLPAGVAMGLPLREAFFAALLGNLLPVPFIILFARRGFAWVRAHIPRLGRWVDRIERKAWSKSDKVVRYQAWGLLLFVAVPLPGTGAARSAAQARRARHHRRRVPCGHHHFTSHLRSCCAAMKILVFSDSHGNEDNMIRAVERERPFTLDAIVHLGDGWRDAEALHRLYPRIPLEQVPGNCDLGRFEERERVVFFGDCRVLLCHGHTLGVKSSLLRASYEARERGAQALLYGHTHIPHIDYHDGLWLVNPGSIGDHRRPSYGVLTVEGDKLSPANFTLE